MRRPTHSTATIAVFVLALAGAAAAVLQARSRLIGVWHGVVVRATAAGVHLDGRPVTALTWPAGIVLVVHNAVASWPAPGGEILRTAAVNLEQPFFAPRLPSIRLQQPLIVSARLWHAKASGDGMAVTITASGNVGLRAEALRVAVEAKSGEVATFKALDATLEPASSRASISGRVGRLVLPLVGWPVAEQTLLKVVFAATTAGTDASTAVAITLAEADWLGVTIRANGALSAPRGRLAGWLAVTVGPGWREAVMRAAYDGAITHAEAQAAVGLLALFGHGGRAPELPLAIADGRVTLAGLLLTRLPDLPALASEPAALQ